ncbi:MAG: universal stress protein [Pirellulaceae bacterium]
MARPMDRELDKAVADSMNLFERARVRPAAAITPRRPSHLLLAIDHSTQDATSIEIVRRLARRFACRATVVDARENAGSNERAVAVASQLDAQAAPKATGDSYEQILTAVEQSDCDLLVVPCPFGRDLNSVGPNSAGTVIDVLLARSPVPLLVIREPYEPEEEIFHSILMILTVENAAAPAAAAWAAGLATPEGMLELELVLEKEMYENINTLMRSIAPDVDVSEDALSEALARAHTCLHQGLQKTASEMGIRYRLKIRLEDEISPLEVDTRSLIVLALERSDHTSQGNVQGRIRLSSHPVLVVCRE